MKTCDLLARGLNENGRSLEYDVIDVQFRRHGTLVPPGESKNESLLLSIVGG